MIEFLQTWAPWVLLAGVFAAMHWIGLGDCSARRRRRDTPADGGPILADPRRAAKEDPPNARP